jgi:hypothetical protein
MDRRGFLAVALPLASAATALGQAPAQQAPTPVSPDPAPRDWSGDDVRIRKDIIALDNRSTIHRRQHRDEAPSHRNALG